MAKANLSETLELLKDAASKGIKISVSGNELIVRYPKDTNADHAILCKLKESKNDLISYFSRYSKPKVKGPEPVMNDDSCIEVNGKCYYEIGSSYTYWIDDKNKEFTEKIYAQIGFRISGKFSVDIFKAAFSYLIGRHESLRASFQCREGRFYIGVEDPGSPAYEVDFRDMRDIFSVDRVAAEDVFYYADHQFDVWGGPLILARVIQTATDEFYLSIKIHHAIYDGWSYDILLRDLITAYAAFEKREQPNLSALVFQYKDYLYYKRRLMEEKSNTQMDYWRSLYEGPPGKLAIPGAKTTDGEKAGHNGEDLHFLLPGKILDSLKETCSRYGTQLFTVFQAGLFMYLAELTGQRDMIIGTLLFGREDVAGVEDQIGNYAYTDVIRVVLEDNDPVAVVIKKVEKAKQDMQRCDAQTLLGFLFSTAVPGQSLSSTCWKVNLYYAEMAGYYVDRSTLGTLAPEGMDIQPLENPRRSTATDLDLKIDLVHFADRLELNVNYDCDTYDRDVITGLLHGYMDHMERVAQ